MAKAQNPPWLMWGASETLTLQSNVFVRGQQLASIQYNRPESWKFMLFAQIAGRGPAIIDPNNVFVQFQLTLGLGRSTITLPLFETYQFQNLAAAPQQTIYSTSVAGPFRLIPDPNTNIIDSFPAQTIQCTCNALFTNPGPADTVAINVGAFFAPRTHIRADWFGHQALGSNER